MPSVLFAKLGFSEKLAFGIHMAMYGTPVTYIFQKYVFNDWDFLISLMLLFFLDTVIGTAVAIKEGRFRSTIGLQRFGLKFIGYTLTILCIGIMDNALIAGKSNWMEGIIDAGAYAVMMAFEGVSVLRNIYKIYPFEPVRIILEKLEIYYKNLNNKGQ